MLTELLQFCFFYPFSSTVTMFPVSVILKVLRPFNPESEKGEPLSATSRGGPCTSDVMGKEKAANHANPFPSFQHCRQAWARALPHFFSDTKNNHTYVSPKYSIFIKQNKKKTYWCLSVLQYGTRLDGASTRWAQDTLQACPKTVVLTLRGK